MRLTAPSTLIDGVRAFAGARVLCVGDVMLDRYVYGAVSRVSPEAPIPVCRVAHERAMPGGAANVARNLAALGAGIDLVGVVGTDAAGAQLVRLVGEADALDAVLLEDPGRPTTVKTRYVADGQQLLRADRETDASISEALQADIGDAVGRVLAEAGAVVLSDYGKGLLTEPLTARIVEAARAAGKPVVVDPKGPDYARYRGAALITPNRRELAEAGRAHGFAGDNPVGAARRIIETCGIEAVLVTRGPDGMILVDAGREIHLPVEAREVFDVSGAGDTVAAALAAACAAGVDPVAGARIANVAAGLVVGKVGTAVASADEVVDALRARARPGRGRMAVSVETALERVAAWRSRGLSIGFTNGCFDLIHAGHAALLRQACDACDRLIVGLNADASARRLKGAGRPVQPAAARAAVLASIEAVDLVVVFEQDTPTALIEAIRPDLLVKGADYRLDDVAGAAFVQGYGGRVLLADILPGHSTTATVARMRDGG